MLGSWGQGIGGLGSKRLRRKPAGGWKRCAFCSLRGFRQKTSPNRLRAPEGVWHIMRLVKTRVGCGARAL